MDFKVCQREVLESTVKRIDENGFQLKLTSLTDVANMKSWQNCRWQNWPCHKYFLRATPIFQWCHSHLNIGRKIGNHTKKKKLFKAFVNYQQKTLGSLSGKPLIFVQVENSRSRQSWTYFQLLMKPSDSHNIILIRI